MNTTIYKKLYQKLHSKNKEVGVPKIQDIITFVKEGCDVKKIKQLEDGYGDFFVSMLIEIYGVSAILKLNEILPKELMLCDDNSSHPIAVALKSSLRDAFRVIDGLYDRDFNLLNGLNEDFEPGTTEWYCSRDGDLEEFIRLLREFKVSDNEFDFTILSSYIEFDTTFLYFDLSKIAEERGVLERSRMRSGKTELEFNRVADIILNRCDLIINSYIYRILEIEFYLCCDTHKDIYTHCNIDQKLTSRWYFHKSSHKTTSKNFNSYKGGTFKGLDISIGNCNTFGGILLRTVECDEYVIEGPCNVVNEILKLNEVESIRDLVNKNVNENESICLNVFECNDLYIRKSDKIRNEIVYKSTRVGLKEEKCPEFFGKRYRYMITPHKIKKQRNIVKEYMRADGMTERDIKNLFTKKSET